MIMLYHAPGTRSFRVLWMLEELGVPYELQMLDLEQQEQKSAPFLELNPMGKVPTLVDGTTKLTESAAICAWLADRFPEKGLAPAMDATARPDYLRWMFFAPGCVEPAFTEKLNNYATDPRQAAWGSFDDVIATIGPAVDQGRYLLGKAFCAADIMVGSVVRWGVFAGLVSDPALLGYNERLGKRSAHQLACEIDSELVA